MAQPATNPAATRIPPYLAFKTFLNSLDTLSQGVPPKLDRSFWKGQSGINQGLIMSAYRYFHLVNDNDESTPDLVVLAQHPEKRSAKLREMITLEYHFVLEKGDITKSTMRMLEEAFSSVYPVTGATKQKAITFFLKAAKFADLPLSPYLLTSLREAAKKPRKSKQRTELNGDEEAAIVRDLASDSPGAVTHSVQLKSGGIVSVIVTANPFMMPLEDRNFVFSMIDMVQKYEAQKQGKNEAVKT
jgi:hypothetical protein